MKSSSCRSTYIRHKLYTHEQTDSKKLPNPSTAEFKTHLGRVASRAVVFGLVVFACQLTDLVGYWMEETAACARILVVKGRGALHRGAVIRAVLLMVQRLCHVL
jgi:hypothetical protein